MEEIKLFFINQENNYIFNLFTTGMIMIITLIGCYIIIKNSNTLRKNKVLSKKINNVFIYTLILQQVFLTIRNIIVGDNNIFSLLPLNLSRVSIILLVLAIITDKTIIKNMACYLGLFIGTYCLLSKGETSYIYFTGGLNTLGFIFLIWGVTYIVSIDGFKLEQKILKDVLIITNTYSIFLIVLNNILKTNYNFINGVISNLYNNMYKNSYILLLLLIINICIVVSHFLIKLILWQIEINFRLEFKPIIENDKFKKAELE